MALVERRRRIDNRASPPATPVEVAPAAPPRSLSHMYLKYVLVLIIAIVLWLLLPFHSNTVSDIEPTSVILRDLSINISYIEHLIGINATNENNRFISDFVESLRKPLWAKNPIPLIIKDGKLLCRPGHIHAINDRVVRSFIEMVHGGLELHPISDRSILLSVWETDSCQCDLKPKLLDRLEYPRFSWSIPATKFGSDWCQAIGMPCYTTFDAFQNMNERKWRRRFLYYNMWKYPWSKKIDKALWRGRTTYDPVQYGNSSIHDIPRGQLVRKSMDAPEVLDAGFVEIIQKFTHQQELQNQTNYVEEIQFEDQMKYKGEKSCVISLAFVQ